MQATIEDSTVKRIGTGDCGVSDDQDLRRKVGSLKRTVGSLRDRLAILESGHSMHTEVHLWLVKPSKNFRMAQDFMVAFQRDQVPVRWKMVYDQIPPNHRPGVHFFVHLSLDPQGKFVTLMIEGGGEVAYEDAYPWGSWPVKSEAIQETISVLRGFK